jgi:hypothetical protein
MANSSTTHFEMTDDQKENIAAIQHDANSPNYVEKNHSI